MILSLSLIIAACLLSPCEVRAGDHNAPPMATVVVGNQIYWQGEHPVVGAFRLNSISLNVPHAVEEHDYALLSSRDISVAWHVLDSDVWTLTGQTTNHSFERYLLERSPLSRKRIEIYKWGEFGVASCQPLDDLRDIHAEVGKQSLHFDYVPTNQEHGKLFVLTEDRKMTVWEFTVGATKLEAINDSFPLLRTGEKWRVISKLETDFFEPFRIYLKNDKPHAITASGKLYTVKALENWEKWVAVAKNRADPIVLTVDDRQKQAVYLFTKRTASVLGQPDSERPFELPAIGKKPDEIGKALLQVVEFIHRK